ncbi:MAG: QueT transporter family protein [Lachnospiraceae bacterium]|nr:QueT transporter family protein [Lachnospiraceae bacterium]
MTADKKEKTSGKISAAYIALAAAIAALYVVITVAFAPISYNMMQVRVSEMLCVLPMFTSAAIPGLFIGCLIANVAGGAIVLDVIFGSLATLIGAVFAYLLRKHRWLVPIPTVIANALIVPFVLKYGYGVEEFIPVIAAWVAAGEVISCCIFGQILAGALKKYKSELDPKNNR